jgi:hypothetical protein
MSWVLRVGFFTALSLIPSRKSVGLPLGAEQPGVMKMRRAKCLPTFVLVTASDPIKPAAGLETPA